MSKKKNIRFSLIVLGALLVPFLISKRVELREYDYYKGKITTIDVVRVKVGGAGRYRGGYDYIYQPTVQYIRDNDTISFTEHRKNLFGILHEVGDKVEVAEEKYNRENARIYSFWYFLETYQIFLILLPWALISSIHRFIYILRDSKK
ncbi:hypothetical protein DVK85_11150 [Flavobacterium arcticum]|uniref:DUF3592 domain-containing protein n=1 Tax=Flavobacterium arcticum TaxID=1784713 RepID=A0A345HDU6_9FLAO|nr:hypothetical protein [Flavobacterium arcticum]AXG74756.1 hypothetical protein DVK85_11150 [Flavobacterium arcticum]KAF2509744.1 hypothetical protein E0W72_09525 [Flavobacterium arcticum]